MTDFEVDSIRWTLHSTRNVYDGDPWLRVDMADVTAPNGDRIEHALVRVPDAAIALIVDEERRAVLMLHRHRWVIDREGYELFGGLVEPGEDPADTALREAVEESGWKPRGQPDHLLAIHPLPGIVRSTMHLFVWRNGADQIADPADPHEAGTVAWVPLSRIDALASEGRLLGTGTALALYHYLATADRAEAVRSDATPCGSAITVPESLNAWAANLDGGGYTLDGSGNVRCELDYGHAGDHHMMLQQYTVGGDEWWLRWSTPGGITGILLQPPCPAVLPAKDGLSQWMPCLLYKDHPGGHRA